MPLNVESNSDLVETNNTQTKRGIFRSRTQPPAPLARSKLLSNNAIPMKPNRKKVASKILNHNDPTTESNSKMTRSQSSAVDEEIFTNVVEKPSFRLLMGEDILTNVVEKSFRLVQDNRLSNSSQVNNYASKGNAIRPTMKDSREQSKNSVVNSVRSLLLQTATNDSKTQSTKISLNNSENNSIPWVMPRERASNTDHFQRSNTSESVLQIGSVKSFVYGANLSNEPSFKKCENFINKDSPTKSNESSLPVVMPVHVQLNKSVSNDVKSTSLSPVDELKIDDDNIKSTMGTRPTNQFETELKTYNENLKKCDQEAKDVIDKFTDSLGGKEEIIKKYEEELSLFNNNIGNLQLQLEESLERTRQLEATISTTNARHTTTTPDEHKSENEKLKEMVRNLEMKLAKRDLHIFNLKEVLSIETHKIKELNKAQEEINKLQRECIDKSREISVLRDELKYTTNMRSELVKDYDEQIAKLKKLLAIREFLLMKQKSEN